MGPSRDHHVVKTKTTDWRCGVWLCLSLSLHVHEPDPHKPELLPHWSTLWPCQAWGPSPQKREVEPDLTAFFSAWREGPRGKWWMGWCCYAFCGVDLWLSHISWQIWRVIQRLIRVFYPQRWLKCKILLLKLSPPLLLTLHPLPWEIYVICSSILKNFFPVNFI